MPTTQEFEGVAYTYQNIGIYGTRSWLGRVVGLSNTPEHGFAYVYVNQTAIVSGSDRTLEDGTTRHLEDGTTPRTVE